MSSNDPFAAADHDDRRANSVADWLAFSAEPVDPPASAKARLFAALDSEAREPGSEPQAATSARHSAATAVTQPAMSGDRSAQSGTMVELREAGEWVSPAPGVRCKQLFPGPDGYRSILLRMDPGAVFPAHIHRGVEEACVLEGRCEFDGYTLETGDYYRAEAGTLHGAINSPDGCLMIILEHGRDFR